MDIMLEPLLLSFKLSFVSTMLLLIVSFPIAYVIAYKGFRGKAFFEALLALPLVLPPTVLGFFVLLFMGKNTFLGDIYFEIFNSPIVFSFEGLVIASMLYSLPFCVQPLLTSFRSVDIELIENAMTHGMKKFEVFLKVLLPSARYGILTAAVLSFAHTLGEFGVVLMVGGSIPGETRVASIAIYESVEMLDFKGAASMSFIMVLLSFALLSLVYMLNIKKQKMVGF